VLLRAVIGMRVVQRGDVLFWDDIATLHNAHADYGPEEHRLIMRCQVMADRIFDPAFVRAALGEPVEA